MQPNQKSCYGIPVRRLIVVWEWEQLNSISTNAWVYIRQFSAGQEDVAPHSVQSSLDDINHCQCDQWKARRRKLRKSLHSKCSCDSETSMFHIYSPCDPANLRMSKEILIISDQLWYSLKIWYNSMLFLVFAKITFARAGRWLIIFTYSTCQRNVWTDLLITIKILP